MRRLFLAFFCLAAPLGVSQIHAQGVSSSYVIAPNDQIQIDVFQEEDLRTSAKVSQDGTITFPLVGTVRIGGLTINQATSRLTELLKKDYLRHPQLTLSVVGFSKKRFTILGQVNSPGIKEMPDQESIDLLEAIGMAGGYTRIANPGKITIKRRRGAKDEVMIVDAKQMAKQGGKGFPIEPGDTITVAESIF